MPKPGITRNADGTITEVSTKDLGDRVEVTITTTTPGSHRSGSSYSQAGMGYSPLGMGGGMMFNPFMMNMFNPMMFNPMMMCMPGLGGGYFDSCCGGFGGGYGGGGGMPNGTGLFLGGALAALGGGLIVNNAETKFGKVFGGVLLGAGAITGTVGLGKMIFT